MRHHFRARHRLTRHSSLVEIRGQEATVIASFVAALLRACRGGTRIYIDSHSNDGAFVSYVRTADIAWDRRCIASVLLDARALVRATVANLRTRDGGIADCANTRAIRV
jgi:hypothetical protein